MNVPIIPGKMPKGKMEFDYFSKEAYNISELFGQKENGKLCD